MRRTTCPLFIYVPGIHKHHRCSHVDASTAELFEHRRDFVVDVNDVLERPTEQRRKFIQITM